MSAYQSDLLVSIEALVSTPPGVPVSSKRLILMKASSRAYPSGRLEAK
jgi:hypothetical protein